MTKIGHTYFSTDATYKGEPGLGGGFNLFATGRVPTLGDNLGSEIFNVSASASIYSFNAHSWVDVYFGIAGPSWVVAYFAEGTHDASQLSLALSGKDAGGKTVLNAGSYTASGLIIGLGVTFHLKLKLEVIVGATVTTTCSPDVWHCTTEVEPIWAEVSDLDLSGNIDIIALIIELVEALSGGGASKGSAGESGTSWPTEDLGKGFSMYAASFGLHQSGSVDLEAEWSRILDISNYIQGVATLKKIFSNFGGGLEAGPVIGFALGTDVEMTDISIGGNKYGNLSFSGNQSSGTIKGTRVGSASAGTTDLEFGFETETTFDFQVGIGVDMSVLKLFSVSEEVKISLLSALGIAPNTGIIPQTLSATVPISAAPIVVLDPPEPVTP